MSYGDLMRGGSARVSSRGTRRCGKNQIGEELAEAAAGNLELEMARGASQPAEIHQQGDLSPRFRSFRRETDVAQNAGDMRGAFFLDAGNARSHTLIAASPRAQRAAACGVTTVSSSHVVSSPSQRSSIFASSSSRS